MNKFERIFYLLIIALQLGAVMFLGTRLKDISRDSKQAIEEKPGISQPTHLYSFKGTNLEGKNDFIHFTAYSGSYYIFIAFSPNCNHCESMLNELKPFIIENKLPSDVEFILVTNEPSRRLDFKCRTTIVSWDDWVQFGFETPTIFAVNGKGDIIFKSKGYVKGIIKNALDKLQEIKAKLNQPVIK